MYLLIGCILCISAACKFNYLFAFKTEFKQYDIIARRFPNYAYIFPCIELLLGIAFLNHFMPMLTNISTLIIMSFSLLGLVRSIQVAAKIK